MKIAKKTLKISGGVILFHLILAACFAYQIVLIASMVLFPITGLALVFCAKRLSRPARALISGSIIFGYLMAIYLLFNPDFSNWHLDVGALALMSVVYSPLVVWIGEIIDSEQVSNLISANYLKSRDSAGRRVFLSRSN